MKTKFFTVDFINKEIRGSERAFNRAGRGFEAELKELTTLMSKHEGFKLVEVEGNKNKNTYEGLDAKFIRDYITLYDAKRLPELDEMEKSFKFPSIKKWFLATYKKDGEKFDVEKEAKKIKDSKYEKKLSAVKTRAKAKLSVVPTAEKIDA